VVVMYAAYWFLCWNWFFATKLELGGVILVMN
jgi:hypothetical protein